MNFLRFDITVYAKSGSGSYGPTYAASVVTKAHIVFGKPVTVNVGASEVTADIVMYLRPEIVCPEGSKVVYDGNNYSVLKYTKHSAPGLPTPDHIKLVLAPYSEES
jgi:hypothetical protein